jgi:5-methylcytosine-specific restriction protein A
VKRKRGRDVNSVETTELEILTRRSDIAAARKLLRKLVASNASKPTLMMLGHQGNTWQGKVYYLKDLDMWTVFNDGENDLWNTYGLGDPSDGRSRNMICHLSVPIEGVNRRVGAVYAKTRAGDIAVLHRGKIGGGREGVGKSSFFEHYDGRIVSAQDGDRITEFANVGSLGTESFLKDVRRFVLAVKDIKAKATQ